MDMPQPNYRTTPPTVKDLVVIDSHKREAPRVLLTINGLNRRESLNGQLLIKKILKQDYPHYNLKTQLDRKL